MGVPSELQSLLDEATNALHAQPEADLRPIYRQALYQYFDALPGLAGRAARTHLALRAARRVLHVYDTMPSEYGYPAMPSLMLAVVTEFQARLLAGATAEALAQLAKTLTVVVVYAPGTEVEERHRHIVEELLLLALEMESLTGELPTSLYYPAWSAFLAAMSALLEALGHDSLVGATIDLATPNADLHCWGDAARWAALAYTGGEFTAFEEQDPADFFPQGTWNYTGVEATARRRDFWAWWLTDLIPDAWTTIAPLRTREQSLTPPGRCPGSARTSVCARRGAAPAPRPPPAAQ